MKYRVRIDLSFANETDARALLEQAVLASAAVSPLGTPRDEVPFYELELCRHDEGLPCVTLERGEVR